MITNGFDNTPNSVYMAIGITVDRVGPPLVGSPIRSFVVRSGVRLLYNSKFLWLKIFVILTDFCDSSLFHDFEV